MSSRATLRRSTVIGAVLGAVVLVPAEVASAHPLGNFTVNHYDGLTLKADRVHDFAVIDTAEIPTSQQRGAVDANHDGTASDGERSAFAQQQCAELAAAARLTVDGARVAMQVGSATFGYRPGVAGLEVSRLECELEAAVDLRQPRTLEFTNDFQGDRVGWHEITAIGSGVHLDTAPVPDRSVSDELRNYPDNLLSSPLDVRSARLDVVPGAGASTFAPGVASVPGAGLLARGLQEINDVFTGLVGRDHIGLGVGLLAVLLSLVLGASHAAMPGHGKTVMAAYIAGRRGRLRDAVTVGATVTLTHTAGVLILGLVLTASSSVAGDKVIGQLGIVSGLLIAAIGFGLLRTALRERRARIRAIDQAVAEVATLTPADAELLTPTSVSANLAHGHSHGHEHGHSHEHGHGHSHPHPHPHDHTDARPLSRSGLIGMGVAGGLVPSPSALVVLLGAIALGRTVFGVLLVVGYGVGMAATLTAAGLLLIRMRDRLDRPSIRSRLRWLTRASALAPILTACLVVVVGLTLAGRGLLP